MLTELFQAASTNDSANLPLYICIAAAAALVFVLVMIFGRKKR